MLIFRNYVSENEVIGSYVLTTVVLPETSTKLFYGFICLNRMQFTLPTWFWNKMGLRQTTHIQSDNIYTEIFQKDRWGALYQYPCLLHLLTWSLAMNFSEVIWKTKHVASFLIISLSSRETFVVPFQVLHKKRFKNCFYTLKTDSRS